ncbi:hypothetical protein KP509_09G018000 [Ceratopteris richardii]|uniref:Transmembrane protein n=1 Tax=Ceratopteris richardii TaxID=49495 RepID=A0A8T2U4X1_CERRI|nr:hypothetical protein KP509_09G018000 [Ceratopteris richardii]
MLALIALIFQGNKVVNIVVVSAGKVDLLVGAMYWSCVWRLACVVTVFEDNCGLGAMRRSLHLIQGKRFVACFLYLTYSILISLSSRMSLVQAMSSSVVWRTFSGCLFILLMSIVYLIGFVLQTFFYFACKAHHHESIDRLQLSEHIGSYLGEDVPLIGNIWLEPIEAH